MKVPFGLAQAPAYFQELMTGILKDFNFAIAYLDNIILFRQRTPFTHQNGIQKTQIGKPFHEEKEVQFFSKEIQYLGYILSATGIRPLPAKPRVIQPMYQPMTPKQVRTFLGLVGYY